MIRFGSDDPEFKAIYGVEGYFINDMLPAVKGQTDAVIDGRYIVFDLEATGLSNASERIIEIGAVKGRKRPDHRLI